jgi:type 1 glutamine amidotransferase
VLFACGGWEKHEPKECAKLFAPALRERGFEVELSEALDSYLDRKKMRDTNLVVQVWSMGKLTGEQERGFMNAVKGGTGLAGWQGLDRREGTVGLGAPIVSLFVRCSSPRLALSVLILV